ncbi:MAG: threonylcarbamoyl-AMP synthase [Burkholderiales bacterium]|nr:threonylcarbamoyl-AMP synthase [Burkholderiales bacterium]
MPGTNSGVLVPGTIAEAARRLAAGDVVAFPTETVYGLGADAANPAAVVKIFALKGRPAEHPLIVHVRDAGGIDEWARDVPDAARKLAARFWPGPLTMILARSARVPDAVTGGQDTVGLRCPSHRVAQELLREFARIGSGAIAAPSANKFGHVSPTTAEHVREEFGNAVPVIDGGACEVGLESTIVDLSRGVPMLLRPGAVSREEIAEVLGVTPRDRDEHAPRASGTLAAHYAPRTRLQLMDAAGLEGEIRAHANVAVLALRTAPRNSLATQWIVASGDPHRYGHDLYANLRALDASGAKRILVEAPPATPEWEAVNDRLMRAAAGSE